MNINIGVTGLKTPPKEENNKICILQVQDIYEGKLMSVTHFSMETFPDITRCLFSRLILVVL